MAHEDWAKPPPPAPTREELQLAWEITDLTSALSNKLMASMQMALAARTKELAECRAQLNATQTDLADRLSEKTRQLQDQRQALSLVAEQRDRNATEREEWKSALMQVATHVHALKTHDPAPAPDKIMFWILQAFVKTTARPEAPKAPKPPPATPITKLRPATLIENQEISIRLANCLENMGVFTVQQLAQKSAQDLLKTKQLGRKTLKEARDLLAKFGLKLKE